MYNKALFQFRYCIRVVLTTAFIIAGSNTLWSSTLTDSTESSTTNTFQSFEPNQKTPSLEQRVELLEKKMDVALVVKDSRLEAIEKSINITYIILGIVGATFAFFTYLGSRAQRQIYSRERTVFVRLAKAQEQRQQDVHDLITKIYENQFQVNQNLDNYRTESVKRVNEIMTTVQQTLHFRLEQEKLVVGALEKIKELEKEVISLKQDPIFEFNQLLDQAKRFAQWKRVDFTNPAKELQEECKLFRERFDRLPLRYLKDHQADPEFGTIFYYRGLIAYIDNHVIEAKKNFERALVCKLKDHQAVLQTNEDYRRRFAFCEFYVGLIHKNYGSLDQCRIHLQNSLELHNPPNEVLAPITLAEALSYEAENAAKARKILQQVHRRLEQRKIQGQLTPYQTKLFDRITLFTGNTYFLEENWEEALKCFEESLRFNKASYYAKMSIAQTKEKLGQDSKSDFEEALNMIEKSGDLSLKTETTPKIILNISALLCAVKADPSKVERCESYYKTLKSTLDSIRSMDGLELRILSPITKARLTKDELVAQIDELRDTLLAA